MYVNQIYLSNFRNYKKGLVKFSKETNVIYGANAKGKTNILEAICIMSTARSHRGAKEEELINIESVSSKIGVEFYSQGRENRGVIEFNRNKKRRIKINNVPIEKTSRLMGYLNSVIFCPEDLKLIKGSPKERRRMIDLGICQLRQKYFTALSEYYKILEQRNRLLKDNPQSEMLWVWSEKLCISGADIIWFRHSYMNKLAIHAKSIVKEICNENLQIEYDCGFEVNDFNDKEGIKNSFLEELKKCKEREIRFGMSLLGPHRDDFRIILNGTDAKQYASQGQQRTIALALKMAEVKLIEEDKGEMPVLLLDDVLSELDEKRREYVLKNIKNIQVIITCTDKDLFGQIPHVNLINVDEIKQEG